MTPERARAIVDEIENRQRKADGSIYQTSQRWGIETWFANGALCSDGSSNRQDAQRRFRHSCGLPDAEVVLYTRRVAGKFGVLEHN